LTFRSKRWFVLRERTLVYYGAGDGSAGQVEEEAGPPKGSMLLESIRAEEVGIHKYKKVNVLEVMGKDPSTGQNQHWVMWSEAGHNDCVEWLDAIRERARILREAKAGGGSYRGTPGKDRTLNDIARPHVSPLDVAAKSNGSGGYSVNLNEWSKQSEADKLRATWGVGQSPAAEPSRQGQEEVREGEPPLDEMQRLQQAAAAEQASLARLALTPKYSMDGQGNRLEVTLNPGAADSSEFWQNLSAAEKLEVERRRQAQKEEERLQEEALAAADGFRPEDLGTQRGVTSRFKQEQQSAAALAKQEADEQAALLAHFEPQTDEPTAAELEAAELQRTIALLGPDLHGYRAPQHSPLGPPKPASEGPPIATPPGSTDSAEFFMQAAATVSPSIGASASSTTLPTIRGSVGDGSGPPQNASVEEFESFTGQISGVNRSSRLVDVVGRFGMTSDGQPDMPEL